MKKRLIQLLTGGALFLVSLILFQAVKIDIFWLEAVFYISAFLVLGYDVIYKALRNILRGKVFDENFLMSVAAIGAMIISEFPEAAAVMLFYQAGELFQSMAVGKSRQSIAELMNIRPDYANVVMGAEMVKKSPEEVNIGDTIIIRPGEKVPLDGTVISGVSALDMSALTGESRPRQITEGGEVLSGSINLSGLLTVRVDKSFGQSTASKILELIENAGAKKSKSESFISKFAKVYTPAVVIFAALLAVVPPLMFSQEFSVWVYRALTFLVVSCPCALVVSVPMSFFGGIGGASKSGILVKGGNYLEALAKTDTVVFDKTGTLTHGEFKVRSMFCVDTTKAELLEAAAYAENYSNHPISFSLKESYKNAYKKEIDSSRIADYQEISGHGVIAKIDGKTVVAGNARLMERYGIEIKGFRGCKSGENLQNNLSGENSFVGDFSENSFLNKELSGENLQVENFSNGEFSNKNLLRERLSEDNLFGTVVHIAVDGGYKGFILISDEIKPDSYGAIEELKKVGVRQTVMLTGDLDGPGRSVANKLKIDRVYTELLPDGKVAILEELLKEQGKNQKIAFVGDGINDAPVLARADIGIAMGGLGSDAAIEAADVVIMNDQPSKIAEAIKIAKKTVRIATQNIVFAISVKAAVLVLSTFGLADMWMAVFADVGVAFLAIINALRALKVKKRQKQTTA